MKLDQDAEILDLAASKLMERWDCVQILVSRTEPNGNTGSRKWGYGNWYARKAMCQELVESDNERNLAIAISREIKPNESHN